MDLDPAILKRARDLRRLAERAGTEHEAYAAAKALASLMERHAIDNVEQLEESDFEFDRDRPLYEGGRVMRWRLGLAQVLGTFCGVIVFVRRQPHSRRRSLVICGRAGDCARMRHMYAWLSEDAERIGRLSRAPQSWRIGWVMGLGLQLRDVHEQTREAAGQSQALVTLDNRRAEVEAHAARAAPSRPMRPRPLDARRIDPDALAAGQAAGRHHPLGGPLP